MQPDVGVDVERKVDRGRSLGELLDVTLRGEDEDLVVIEVDLEEFEELLGRVTLLLQLEELPEPGELPSHAVGVLPLYSQCAAMPYSAVRCISRVRIWISKSWPPGPKIVVCSDW